MSPQKCLQRFSLSDGNAIPAVGLGTWKARDEEVYEIVKHSLSIGYRHIDTAAAYRNEEPVGRAIKDSGIPREEIFVTTKLWCTNHDDPMKALKASLQKLQLDYVDLYLMHWPVFLNPEFDSGIPLLPSGKRDIVADWTFVKSFELMQECAKSGLAKSIGVSNFSVKNLKTLSAANFEYKPVINQVECHPYLPQFGLEEYCKEVGIVLEAYSPLGSDGSPLLKDETLIKLGEKYDVSPATIIFSWLVGRGISPLPKSINPKRVEQNLLNVELAEEDVELINGISKSTSKRFCDPDWDPIDVFVEN